MVTDAQALPSLSSGDDRFDMILGGGIPLQSVVVITGEPGSGKTVLTMQMLFRAAREGRRCLYFTTISEPAIRSEFPDTGVGLMDSSCSWISRYSA